MKTISAALNTHLSGEVTTTAICWKATLASGAVFGFTSHSQNITFGSVVYSAATGETPSAIVSSADLSVDNLDVQGILDSSVITEADIAAGRWDYASIEIFLVNWADLTQGSLKLRLGRLGQIKTQRLNYTAEMRGLTQNLQQTIGELYSATCRAVLGDTRCTKSLVAFTFAGTVTNTTTLGFVDASSAKPDDYYGGGKVTFNTGLNTGLSMEVNTYQNGIFRLVLPMPYAIAIGDTYTAIAGCRKNFTDDCKTKFSNVVNFRGEPHVPGNDQLAKVGGT